MLNWNKPKVNMDDEREMGRTVSRRKTASNLSFCVKKEKGGQYRKVYTALQKKEVDLSEEEQQLILNNADLVKKARESLKKREEVKARSEEVEDPDDVLIPKCQELAAALRNSHHLVVYTGAGISTAAAIPDYRGSNGIWTLLQKGKDIGKHDLSRAEPTLTHMALSELYSRRILKYVVSQNCDGLHLRSGLPRSAVSEVHGNMHLEVCQMCRPSTQYWRMFDVTENTGRFTHRTMRRCHICHSALIDTIVHFGERGNLPWPLNWPAASKAANNADTILCIGSSLKVLKKYPWLWGMDKPVRKRPKLYIINLQWTPKDDHAVLKINGRCDRVMQEVMKCLDLKIPEYSRLRDPIFSHATHLHPDEAHTTSQPELDCPFKKDESSKDEIKFSKQGLKRINTGSDDTCPVKVKKLDHDFGIETVVKNEPLDMCENEETSVSALPKMKLEGNEGSNSLMRIRSPASQNKSAVKLIEGHTFGRSKAVIIEKEAKPEPMDDDERTTYPLTLKSGSELLTPVIPIEEVVEQIHWCVDPKSSADIIVDIKGNDCHTLQRGSKKEEDSKPSILLSGQNTSGNIVFESNVCPKPSLESITVGFCSTDGKENVAVCVSKVCSVETAKSSKRLDCEKTQDLNSESEKPSKSQASCHGIQTSKSDPTIENFGSLKSQKINGKGANDNLEDEVVVLKMLQLEHNYSKSSSDCQESIGSLPKDTKQGIKTGLIDKKSDSISFPNETRRNLRRTSKDAVNYLEPEEEEEEEEDEDDEDDDDESEANAEQSVRTSRRVKDKQNAKQQAKKQEKQLAKVDAKKKVEGGKKLPESNAGSHKANKPVPPTKNKKLTIADFEMRTELKARVCNFCLNFYMSKTCLFYPSLDFRPRQFEGCICECCDYSSESEDAEEEGSNGETNEGKGDSTDNADEGASKTSIINPGWYGKGYRKRFRKRK